MGNILDFSTSNAQISDEIIEVSDSNPITLQHDIIYNKTGKLVEIWTGAGGTGTQLTNTTDYVIGNAVPDAYFPTSISPDVGYTTVAITNATYHNTPLYISYYPISDVIRAERYNRLNIVENAGDFDISTTDQTLSMAKYNSYPIGSQFRVSWHSGDGSNDFQFTDTTGLTLNDIAFTEWVGQGVGFLEIIKTGATTWETWQGQSDIWDSYKDTDNIMFKTISGDMRQSSNDPTVRTTTGGSAPIFFTPGGAALTYKFAYAVLNSHNAFARYISGVSIWVTVGIVSTTGGNVLGYSNNNSTTCTLGIETYGKWTTLSPRKKGA